MSVIGFLVPNLGTIIVSKRKLLFTLIKVACKPLPKEGLVVFKTPTRRGRGGGARLFTKKTLDFESSVKVKF